MEGAAMSWLAFTRAANSSFSELISGFRRSHSTPNAIFFNLGDIQKIDRLRFSLRLLPAASGVLTAAALLGPLPRAGFPPAGDFLAELAATPRAHRLFHHQDGGSMALIRGWRTAGRRRWGQ